MNTLINKSKVESSITKCRKASNDKVYQSFNLKENDYYHNNTNTDNNYISSIKRAIKY